MALAYYGVKLSPNWVETPEGFIVFKNAVIGRTGFQTYKGYELDKDELTQQGIVVADDDDVQLYRDEADVFAPATLASFVGKSVTDGHPSELLSLENVKDHEEGQVYNVRRGSEPLESGDFPMLADLMIKSGPLIEKIKDGLRELSCGYNYHVRKDGKLIKQVGIIGNHVAVVENARAGREAVIVDSIPVLPTPERWNPKVNILDRVLNSNRKAKLVTWAKDAKPEEVADIIDTLTTELDSRPEVVTRVRVAHDVTPANDKENPDRKKWHDALDRYFDGTDEEEENRSNEVKAIGKMIKGSAKDSAVDEEEEEEKKGEDSADDEEEEESEGEDEEADDEGEAGALTIEPSDRPQSLGPGTDELRDARNRGARDMLKLLKPMIAKSGNKKLIAAYDQAARKLQGKSQGKTGDGYARFAEASVKRGKDAQDSVDNSDKLKKTLEQIDAWQKPYQERFNKGRSQ